MVTTLAILATYDFALDNLSMYSQSQTYVSKPGQKQIMTGQV